MILAFSTSDPHPARYEAQSNDIFKSAQTLQSRMKPSNYCFASGKVTLSFGLFYWIIGR